MVFYLFALVAKEKDEQLAQWNAIMDMFLAIYVQAAPFHANLVRLAKGSAQSVMKTVK